MRSSYMKRELVACLSDYFYVHILGLHFSASTLEIFSLVSCKKKPMGYTELTECYLDSIRAAEFGLFGRIISKIYLRA